MIPYPRGGQETVPALEGAKEKLGEPIDYLSLVLAKLALALSMKPGSTARNFELNDLEDLLFPFLDDEFKKDREQLEGEHAGWTAEKGDWNSAYQRGRVKILLKVMKRNDMLTLGTI